MARGILRPPRWPPALARIGLPLCGSEVALIMKRTLSVSLHAGDGHDTLQLYGR